jgi:hypothetical protein
MASFFQIISYDLKNALDLCLSFEFRLLGRSFIKFSNDESLVKAILIAVFRVERIINGGGVWDSDGVGVGVGGIGAPWGIGVHKDNAANSPWYRLRSWEKPNPFIAFFIAFLFFYQNSCVSHIRCSGIIFWICHAHNFSKITFNFA